MSRRKLPCPRSLFRTPPVWAAALLTLAVAGAFGQAQAQAPHLLQPHAALSFEANQGQTSAQAQFLARSQGAVVFLTERGMVIKTTAGAVGMQFVGAGARPLAQGENPAPTRVHYISRAGDLAVASYGAVGYADMYPGVDVRYYGHQGLVEYDLTMAPHAAPGQVRLRFTGATPHLAANGSLQLGAGMVLRAPSAYQTIAGRRHAVRVGYVLHADHSIGLRLGAYDANRALVVDPVLAFSTYLGGATGYNQANAVAVDSNGNGYVVGYTLSTDFPVVAPYQTNLAAGTLGPAYDAFVSEVSSDGTSLVYSTYLGGNGDDRATGVAVDATGAAYVTGYTTSTNFPVVGGFQTANAGGKDAFIAKLAPGGATLSYSSYLGGTGDDQGNGIALDASNEAFVVGTTSSSNFPATAGAGQTTFGGKTDAFVAKVSVDGGTVLYATYMGGADVDAGNAIAVDPTGDAYIGGSTASTDFPASTSAWQTALAGRSNGFLAQIAPTGQFGFVTYLGGSNADEVNGVAVDASGNVFAAGDTTSANLFCPTGGCGSISGYQQNYQGGTDAFVAEANNSGRSFVYGSYLGGPATDVATAIVLDGHDGAYVAGYTNSTSFPATNNATQPNSGGGQDAFLAKLDSTGQNLLFSTYLGGSLIDAAHGLGINSAGDLFITGTTQSSNFPVQPATAGGTVAQPALAGANDAFAAKFVVAAQGVFSTTAMGFPAQSANVASAAQAVTFSNGGELPLTITGITTTGPYTETDNCIAAGTLQPQASCTINVVFTPTATGAQDGTLVVADNGPGGSQTLPLSGSGGDFTLTVAPTSETVAAGNSASFALEVSPATGFTGVVALSCSGIGSDQNATCAASPTSLTMNGSTASAATVTITTTVRPALLPWLPAAPSGPWMWLALSGLLLALLGAIFALRTRGVRRRMGWVGTAVLVGCSLAAVGCGGTASNPGTPAGNYTVTITGQTGSSTHTQTVVLTVD